MEQYHPMALATLAGHLICEGSDRDKWKLVWEFLEEHRWEPPDVQAQLVSEEPPPTGDERWDALLAALAEHLNAKLDLAPRTGLSLACCTGHGSHQR